MIKKNIAIYIHWPFCLALCPYCDFNSHLYTEIDSKAWLLAYQKEIDYYADYLKNKQIKSIFIGGGTPSLMSPIIVEGIIDKLASVAEFVNDIEITMEANPTSADVQKFLCYRDAGVNRISIGVQSFNDKHLKFLGRKHDSKMAISAIEAAQKIFSRYSFDLIYSLQGQTIEQWKAELNAAKDLVGGHLSLYQLTIEKGTPFYKKHRQGFVLTADEDIAYEMYQMASHFLAKQGLDRYEISNYAKKGEECRHNMVYWHYGEYLGIGAGAHSRLHMEGGIKAVMNLHSPTKWLDSVNDKGHSVQKENFLPSQEAIEEMVMMSTRLQEGLCLNSLKALLGVSAADIFDFTKLDMLSREGFLEFNTEKLRFLAKGLLLHNYLVPQILCI